MSELTEDELIAEGFTKFEIFPRDYGFYEKDRIVPTLFVTFFDDRIVVHVPGKHQAMAFPVENIQDVRKIMADLGLKSLKSDI